MVGGGRSCVPGAGLMWPQELTMTAGVCCVRHTLVPLVCTGAHVVWLCLVWPASPYFLSTGVGARMYGLAENVNVTPRG